MGLIVRRAPATRHTHTCTHARLAGLGWAACVAAFLRASCKLAWFTPSQHVLPAQAALRLAPLLCKHDPAVAARKEEFVLYCAAFSAQEAVVEQRHGQVQEEMVHVPMHMPAATAAALDALQRAWLVGEVAGEVRGPSWAWHALWRRHAALSQHVAARACR